MKPGDKVEARCCPESPWGWDWRQATVIRVHRTGPYSCSDGPGVEVTFEDPPTDHPTWIASPGNVRPIDG